MNAATDTVRFHQCISMLQSAYRAHVRHRTPETFSTVVCCWIVLRELRPSRPCWNPMTLESHPNGTACVLEVLDMLVQECDAAGKCPPLFCLEAAFAHEYPDNAEYKAWLERQRSKGEERQRRARAMRSVGACMALAVRSPTQPTDGKDAQGALHAMPNDLFEFMYPAVLDHTEADGNSDVGLL